MCWRHADRASLRRCRSGPALPPMAINHSYADLLQLFLRASLIRRRSAAAHLHDASTAPQAATDRASGQQKAGVRTLHDEPSGHIRARKRPS